MGLEWIEATLEQKNAFRLLRAKWAGFALECMFQAFPTSEVIERSKSDMIAIISSRLSDRLSAGQEAPDRQPSHLLTYWSEHPPKWLTPRMGTDGEMTYTLSAGARDAMLYLEQARVEARISTESLMTNLMSVIEDAASRLSGDIEHRIAHLKARRDEIDAEIEKLGKDGMEPLGEDALSDVAARVQVETSQILAQLRDLPDMIATFRNESEELTFTDQRSKAEVMGELIAKHERLHNTQAYRSMASMSALYSQMSMRTRFEGALEATLHAARGHLGVDQSKSIRAFMTSFTRATNAILDEERRVFEQQKEYLRRNESEQSRREKRAALELNRALVRVREEMPSGPASSKLRKIRLNVSGFHLLPPRNTTMHFEVKMPEMTEEASVVQPLDRRKMTDSAKRVCSAVALGKTASTSALIDRINGLLQEHEEISLRHILAQYQPKTGLREVVQYLKIAASHLPATYEERGYFYLTMPAANNGRVLRLASPDPLFTRQGKPGRGLQEFVAHMRLSKDKIGQYYAVLLPDTDISKIERAAQ